MLTTYCASIEHCARHLHRTLKALRNERTDYTGHPDGVTIVASIDDEISKVIAALDCLAIGRDVIA